MSQKSILIAEDDEDLLQMLQDALARFDCKIYAVKDGEQALELLKEVQPTLMILDLELPHTSGEVIIRAIQSNAGLKAMPLIITTASPAAYIRQFERFATLVLQKPYPLTVITTAVDKALNGND